MTAKTSTFEADRSVEIPVGRRRLQGIFAVPPAAMGVVVFAHGSGSGRHSPRNQFVAHALQEGELATLLVDLLAEDEAEDREKVFDVALLADRLQSAADWSKNDAATRDLPLGYFGASTGAAAALIAAAKHPDVAAIVSRGGRPDLAANSLRRVAAPTLLIVGGRDDVVVDLNREAYEQLECEKELTIIPGATHLFPEPGALEHVARLARAWFCGHLAPRHARKRGLRGQES